MKFVDYLLFSYLGSAILFFAGVWIIYNTYKDPIKPKRPSPLGGDIAGYAGGVILIIASFGILRGKILGHW